MGSDVVTWENNSVTQIFTNYIWYIHTYLHGFVWF